MNIHNYARFFAPSQAHCLIVAGVAFWAWSEASALMVPLATTTLVDRAECIVEGHIVHVASRWTDDHTLIISEVELDVTDALLGATNRVTFLYEGGTVDGLKLQVSDMPVFSAGQRILVFLRPPMPREVARERSQRNRGLQTLVGAAQGAYRIEGDRAVKDGFSVTAGSLDVDRNADVGELKARILERVREKKMKGGRP